MSLRLLDIIVAKREEAQLSETPASEFFDYLSEMFTEENRNMHFVFSYDEGTVWAEVNLIKTVLVNLIDNACKASDEGSTVRISGRRLDDGYQFEIADEGIGIPKEEQNKITKAFYMVDKSRARSKNGAGLGLALCAEILKIHQSELLIQSEQGKGSRIGFILGGRS